MKIAREKFKTFGDVFDQFTIRNLVALCKKGVFAEGTLSPVKIGKEANIFSAEDDTGKRVCLKIYRLETANFNRMYHYIKSDPRFIGLIHNRRKVIFAWAQRELFNLKVATKAGVPCPTPIKRLHNVLVMEFVQGEGRTPAPMLKDAAPENPGEFLSNVLEGMHRFYLAGFVHGDLSAFNILNRGGKPVFIDFSHATPNTSPIFKELLERDAKNLADYFSELGVETSIQRILAFVKGK